MGSEIEMLAQVAQARNMSIDERRHCCVTFEIIRMGKKPVVSVTYENKRILMLPFYLKGQCPDYAHARASSVFSSKDNRTVILTQQDFLPDRTADGDLLF